MCPSKEELAILIVYLYFAIPMAYGVNGFDSMRVFHGFLFSLSSIAQSPAVHNQLL